MELPSASRQAVLHQKDSNNEPATIRFDSEQLVVEQMHLDLLPPIAEAPTKFGGMGTPAGYKGLAAFHKYWGKKPVECISCLLDLLTDPDDLVIDPFVGSGFVAREAVLGQRRFIGVDVNPVAVELSILLLQLPDASALQQALNQIRIEIQTKIFESYQLEDGSIATHFLWDETEIQSVWISRPGARLRQERDATLHDRKLIASFESYKFVNPLNLEGFHNSRINTTADLSLSDLFTGRARRNIDLILDAINRQPENLQRALRLALTSASGQMSKMVFAITGRGKKTGQPSTRIEIGSWVIGYWRPPLHFEINVWNCFEKRVNTLVKATKGLPAGVQTDLGEALQVVNSQARAAIIEQDAKTVLASLPDNCASLIITDPPHGDRIPYLEMSGMWNALLGKAVNFADEIVVSNARGRNKTKQQYTADMILILTDAYRVLKPGKFLAVLFNARDVESWSALTNLTTEIIDLTYLGSFPMVYSANSVVQDNRTGGLKNDYVLIYQKSQGKVPPQLEALPHWTSIFPKN